MLTIYEANANKISRLTRTEIVILIKFSGTLFDLSALVSDLERIDAEKSENRSYVQTMGDRRAIRLLLANACGHAAEFLETVLEEPRAKQDRPFIAELQAAYKKMDWARIAARPRVPRDDKAV